MFFHNFVFLYSIANMISKNPTKYQEEINEIKAFILISPLNEITVYIHNLEGFYSKEMEEKILSSKNTRFLFCLLESSNEETTKRILNEIMESKPNSEKIYRLARMLNKSEEKLDELKTMIFDLDVPKQTKGKYLLAFYEGIKNVKNELDSFAIIDEIVLLNDFDTTNKLMSRLNEETKRTIITRYFHCTNKKLIFTLACTTDCEETTLLINRILLDIKEEEVFSLIMFVKEKYLPLIFKKVLKDEKTVLKLINNLYLFGSNRWMNIINYITEVDYDIISPSKIKEMTSFMEKEETKASRKRSLT